MLYVDQQYAVFKEKNAHPPKNCTLLLCLFTLCCKIL